MPPPIPSRPQPRPLALKFSATTRDVLMWDHSPPTCGGAPEESGAANWARAVNTESTGGHSVAAGGAMGYPGGLSGSPRARLYPYRETRCFAPITRNARDPPTGIDAFIPEQPRPMTRSGSSRPALPSHRHFSELNRPNGSSPPTVSPLHEKSIGAPGGLQPFFDALRVSRVTRQGPDRC
jgi:hypothetical protein